MLTRQLPLRRRHVLTAAALVAVVPLAACGEEDAVDASSDRPQVTFTADDTSIDAPAEVPSGLVDITLDTAPGDVGHHIFVARLDDDITFQQAMDDDESFFTSMTIKGGNGTIAAGKQARLTLDLGPGNYFVLDNPQNETSPTDQFVVVDSDESTSEPEAKGRVRLGPGMRIELPEDFDGRGVWEFVNVDPDEVHEAAMVKLAVGTTGQDLVDWFHDPQGPPPIEGEFGSMGAIGPGQRAWMELEPGEPGTYLAVCFIPGRDGIPHLAKSMFVEFEVTAS